ncbi:TonB-dependent receptor [Flavobacterium terrae]|uniref:Outer membrane receptor proteins, mostly Fe transport n=1 Tax=Flavobacterium terrae TaxID=415425 RepID=A0A1M6BCA7_9FLAO|nr:TonB-dependent receptor [Flavobacterium terrae]SHI46359.1 Outer membrane receptor proteins, mostly Fe transport [Flavobacterium terrae]
MRSRLTILFLLFSLITFAQKTSVSGVVSDKDLKGEPLPFANVSIKGTTQGASTDIDGKYAIEVAPGTHTIVFSFLGYESKEVTFTITEGQNKTINETLGSGSVTMEDVLVKATVSREKESALLLEQKKAIEIKQNIGAQELSRKGVGDVATAVAKTSGVSKQEGSNNVYVRGLGDRYNSTSINGLPVPSNDPEKKNIALDIFTTDIVEYISIDKVYSSKVSGDFAGGNVDISTKNYKGKGLLEVSIGSSANTNAVKKAGDFNLQQGPNEFGYTTYGKPANGLNAYNFENSLAPKGVMPIGGNLNIKAGKSFNIGKEGRLNLFSTGGFSNNYQYREGINQSVDAQGTFLKGLYQEKTSYSTNTTGMFNANYSINSSHKIGYNFLFVNSSDQTRDIYNGFLRDQAEDGTGLVQRATYTQNQLLVNQLIGNHKIGNKWELDWGGSLDVITGNMPDRTQNTLKRHETLDGYRFVQNAPSDNHRYYQNLKENEIAARLSLSYKFGADDKGKITVGYNGRLKERDFEAFQYNFRIRTNHIGSGTTTIVDPSNLDLFFNQTNYENNFFSIIAYAGYKPQVYSGEQNIHAGYLNLEYKLSEKLSAVVGVRGEKIEQNVKWKTQFDPEGGKNKLNRNEILPNLVVKYELNEKQNLRFGASKTYTLPQFKERALFVYEDVTEIKRGNPYLYSSQNYNADLKWELFPKNDELLSVTAFGKYIIDPMNEITMASSTNDITYANTGDWGHVYGIELEARKNIFDFSTEKTNKLSVGLNVSYMKTNQELNGEKVAKETKGTISTNLTSKEAGFTGASDLLLNTDVSYNLTGNNDKGLTATLAYNYYSDRLYALGVEQKGNLIDKGMGTLDFILKTKLNQNLGLNLSAKNFLNPEFKRIQENIGGSVPVLTYKKGVFFGLSLDYKF